MKKINLLIIALVLTFMTTAYAQPESPTDLTAVEMDMGMMSRVILTWNHSGNSGHMSGNHGNMFRSQLRFNIYRKDLSNGDSVFTKIFTQPFKNKFYDKYVTAGGNYSYYVTAVDTSGESAPSDTVTVELGGIYQGERSVHVSGYVTSTDSIPLYSKLRFISNIFRHRHNGHFWTDSSGYYEAELFPGDYIIHVTSEGYKSEFYDDAYRVWEADRVTFNENDTVQMNFTLDTIPAPSYTTLSGTVKDTAGEAIEAHVFAYKTNSYSHFRRTKHTVTDADGNYSLSVPLNDSVVVYTKPVDPFSGFLPEFYNDKKAFAEADRIFIEGNTDSINFVLESKPEFDNAIAGNVSDTSGAAVYAHVVAIKADMNHSRNVRFRRVIETDSLGNYSINNLNPGNYYVIAHPEDGFIPSFYTEDGSITMNWKDADSVYVDSSGTVENIDFDLLPTQEDGFAEINGTLNIEMGDDGSGNTELSGKYVYAIDENGTVQGYGITNAEGHFSITDLIPGTYSVSASEVDYSSETVENVQVDYISNETESVSLSMSEDEITNIGNGSNATPSEYTLKQNYPNPFNPSTTIQFSIPVSEKVKLDIFNVLGQKVATLVNGNLEAGTHKVQFNASNLSSGIYFYRVHSENFNSVKKMTLIK